MKPAKIQISVQRAPLRLNKRGNVMQSENQRFKHSKLTARAAEKADRIRLPDIDFGGRFEDVSAEQLKKEKTRLSAATKAKLIAIAIARTSKG